MHVTNFLRIPRRSKPFRFTGTLWTTVSGFESTVSRFQPTTWSEPMLGFNNLHRVGYQPNLISCSRHRDLRDRLAVT
jgi:hypothetical protein